MTMQYWLVKQEPDSYPWSAFVADGATSWDGVRNYQARNFLRAMRRGDSVLFYASGDAKEVQGLATVSKAPYPDPSATEGDWVSVELKPKQAPSRPVTLAEMKADGALKDLLLLRHTRLSVVPVTPEQFERILKLAGR